MFFSGRGGRGGGGVHPLHKGDMAAPTWIVGEGGRRYYFGPGHGGSIT